jgi:hypothetical protein
MLAVAQWIHIQRLSPENKGALPYISLQAGYRSKQQGLTHTWLHATSGGYFTPSAMSPSSHLDFLSFISLLYHPLPLATLSEHRLACFFLFFSSPPLCYTAVEHLPSKCEALSSNPNTEEKTNPEVTQ